MTRRPAAHPMRGTCTRERIEDMRFGVLGDAKIAREKLLPAIRAAGHEVTHVGRRDPSAGIDPVWGDVLSATMTRW